MQGQRRRQRQDQGQYATLAAGISLVLAVADHTRSTPSLSSAIAV
jgi:hypothetical protein